MQGSFPSCVQRADRRSALWTASTTRVNSAPKLFDPRSALGTATSWGKMKLALDLPPTPPPTPGSNPGGGGGRVGNKSSLILFQFVAMAPPSGRRQIKKREGRDEAGRHAPSNDHSLSHAAERLRTSVVEHDQAIKGTLQGRVRRGLREQELVQGLQRGDVAGPEQRAPDADEVGP